MKRFMMNNIDKSLQYISLLKKEFPDRTVIQIVYDALDFVNPTGKDRRGRAERNIPITDSYIEMCLEKMLEVRAKIK